MTPARLQELLSRPEPQRPVKVRLEGWLVGADIVGSLKDRVTVAVRVRLPTSTFHAPREALLPLEAVEEIEEEAS